MGRYDDRGPRPSKDRNGLAPRAFLKPERPLAHFNAGGLTHFAIDMGSWAMTTGHWRA